MSDAERGNVEPSAVIRFVRRAFCLMLGHPTIETRRAILLTEWRCQNCGGRFVSHRDHGDTLLSADAESDRIFEEVA